MTHNYERHARPGEEPEVEIAIRAESSLADPNTCKFTTDRIVHRGGPFFFESQEYASGSPLVAQLFAIGGIVDVLVADNGQCLEGPKRM